MAAGTVVAAEVSQTEASVQPELDVAGKTSPSATAGSGLPPTAPCMQLPPPEVTGGLPWRYLATRETDWDASNVTPTLNLRLDGRIVPSNGAPSGARVSYSHLVVLDDFIGEPERAELMAFFRGPGNSAEQQIAESTAVGEASGCRNAAAPAVSKREASELSEQHPVEPGAAGGTERAPGPRWERATADRAGLAATWGLKVTPQYSSALHRTWARAMGVSLIADKLQKSRRC